MTDEAKCQECRDPISLETGYKFIDSAQERGFFCLRCRADDGRGYTIADLKQMGEDARAEYAKYELDLMERIGPDVYFSIKAAAERRKQLKRAMERQHRMLAGIVSALETLGVIAPPTDTP